MSALTLSLDAFITKRKAEALAQKALKSGIIPTIATQQNPFKADNTQFYIQVFPHTRDDEQPTTIGVSQLSNIANLAAAALSTVSSLAALTGLTQDEGTPSDRLSGAAITCSITKTINDVGTWSITVKNTENWHKFFRNGDWVTIFLGDDIQGQPKDSIRMIGQIDRIQENKTTTKMGSKVHSWTISGRDFGRVFEDTSVYLSRYQATASDFEILMTKLIPSDQIKDPSTYIKQYLKVVLSDSSKSITKLEVPSDLCKSLGKFGNGLLGMLDQDINPGLGHCAAKSLPDGTYMTLIDMIQAASNAPWNEFVFEVVGGLPTFIFQPAIFETDQLVDLGRKTAIDVDSLYIVDRHLGLSDHERINFIEIHGITNSDQDLEHAVVASKNIPAIPRSIQKYGLKKYEVTSEFAQPLLALSPLDKKNNVDNTVYNALRDVLSDYLFSKHKFLNGTIQLLTDNFVPTVGKWIRLDKDLCLKVEGIDLAWEHGEAMSIEVTVTHGISSTGTSPFIEDAVSASAVGPTLSNTDDRDPILKTKKMKAPSVGNSPADVASSIAGKINDLLGGG